MTRTARRRWSRELEWLVDGIAFGDSGPLLVHGYEEPSMGKWDGDVIPGKLAALDRTSGDVLWSSPCEVGYGRGFGAGLGSDDVVVMGPSPQGHRMVRMSLENGELIGAAPVPVFDEALVFEDFCFSLSPDRIHGILTSDMVEVWSYRKAGYRFHQISRQGDDLFIVAEDKKTKLQGVIVLNAETGRVRRQIIDTKQKLIYGSAAVEGAVVALVSDLLEVVPPTQWPEDDSLDGMHLVALPLGASVGDPVLWNESVPVDPGDDYPDVHIWADSGKVYVLREAMIDVRDALTGRQLGELTVPGLDERVACSVRQGAGLLAEEERVSIFEIPV